MTSDGSDQNLSLGVLIYSDRGIAETVELAKLSESLGCNYFWYTDVRFARECYVVLGSIASATKNILLAPGVTDPYSRHPALTAVAIATLDEMSNGRAVLGLGVGAAGFKELGITPVLPIAAMREAIAVFRGLLTGNEVTVEGKVISLEGGALTFEPVRSEVPVFIATHGFQMSKLAGRIADGMWIANTLDPQAFQLYVDKVDEGLGQENRPRESIELGLRIEACISSDSEAAKNVMRKRVAGRILGQYPHWDYLAKTGLTLPDEFVALGGNKTSDVIGEASRLIPMEIVDAMVLSGDADRVAEGLQRAIHPRMTQLTLRPHAVPGESLSNVVTTFVDDVMSRITI
ncbi:MAG: LLM class flavin-dependent oxidoreductase [Planctomycetaceae bacterium]|nr:LLM class flavin-dependent oxidoreductase [Planctomycetaceae bacterium]